MTALTLTKYDPILGNQPDTNVVYDQLLRRYLNAAMSIPGRLFQGRVLQSGHGEMRGWLLTSESALRQGWDNPQDAQYDAL
jgi:hypothetical protein